MKRKTKSTSTKATRTVKTGLPPGSLVHVGERRAERVIITLFDYTAEAVEEKTLSNIEDCFPYRDKQSVTWINVTGLHEIEVIQKIGAHFGVHPLVLEDILNTTQRPKVVEYDDYLFIVLQMLFSFDGSHDLHAEQISIILGRNFVLSFQESVADLFNPVRDRIRSGKGRIRRLGPDYLAYSLLDAIVDNYFPVLDKVEEAIELLDQELLEAPGPHLLDRIHHLKRDILFIRKYIWPVREVIMTVEKEDFDLVHESTEIFLRDLYDHTIQAIDAIELFRETLTGMKDTYLSDTTVKMNEVITMLTMMASIFIPLTFVAGIYGMNFEHMPELKWRYGYPLSILFMAAIALTLYFYFKRKGWTK